MKRPVHGFTVVEMVTIMVVIGILSAIAIPRLTQTGAFSSSAYRNEVASALRHAQKSAVSHRRLVCAALTKSTVKLTIASQTPPCNRDFSSPDGSSYQSRDSGVEAGGDFIGHTLYFQPSGDITTDAAGAVFAVGPITVTGQAPLMIDGRTGYVE
ncbi:pilus assembly FimT family protein [Pseudoduganella sp. HUAS MS19]